MSDRHEECRKCVRVGRFRQVPLGLGPLEAFTNHSLPGGAEIDQGLFDAKSTADEVLSGVDLKGKRFFITGASSGIGLETVRSLVGRGASVVGAVRDLAGAESSLASVRAAASIWGGSLTLIELDLASLRAIRASANKLMSEGRPFDVIIANAGVMATPFGRTADGFEALFNCCPTPAALPPS